MGTFRVRLQVGNPRNGISETVDALVDTGASYSMMPASLLSRLGIETERTISLRVASGQSFQFPTGVADFSTAGYNGTARVVFGPEGQYLMGATTLEDLALAVDPLAQRLIPTEGLLMSPQLIQEPEI